MKQKLEYCRTKIRSAVRLAPPRGAQRSGVHAVLGGDEDVQLITLRDKDHKSTYFCKGFALPIAKHLLNGKACLD